MTGKKLQDHPFSATLVLHHPPEQAFLLKGKPLKGVHATIETEAEKIMGFKPGKRLVFVNETGLHPEHVEAVKETLGPLQHLDSVRFEVLGSKVLPNGVRRTLETLLAHSGLESNRLVVKEGSEHYLVYHSKNHE